jgi:hypothetical protein
MFRNYMPRLCCLPKKNSRRSSLVHGIDIMSFNSTSFNSAVYVFPFVYRLAALPCRRQGADRASSPQSWFYKETPWVAVRGRGQAMTCDVTLTNVDVARSCNKKFGYSATIGHRHPSARGPRLRLRPRQLLGPRQGVGSGFFCHSDLIDEKTRLRNIRVM